MRVLKVKKKINNRKIQTKKKTTTKLAFKSQIKQTKSAREFNLI